MASCVESDSCSDYIQLRTKISKRRQAKGLHLGETIESLTAQKKCDRQQRRKRRGVTETEKRGGKNKKKRRRRQKTRTRSSASDNPGRVESDDSLILARLGGVDVWEKDPSLACGISDSDPDNDKSAIPVHSSQSDDGEIVRNTKAADSAFLLEMQRRSAQTVLRGVPEQGRYTDRDVEQKEHEVPDYMEEPIKPKRELSGKAQKHENRQDQTNRRPCNSSEDIHFTVTTSEVDTLLHVICRFKSSAESAYSVIAKVVKQFRLKAGKHSNPWLWNVIVTSRDSVIMYDMHIYMQKNMRAVGAVIKSANRVKENTRLVSFLYTLEKSDLFSALNSIRHCSYTSDKAYRLVTSSGGNLYCAGEVQLKLANASVLANMRGDSVHTSALQRGSSNPHNTVPQNGLYKYSNNRQREQQAVRMRHADLHTNAAATGTGTATSRNDVHISNHVRYHMQSSRVPLDVHYQRDLEATRRGNKQHDDLMYVIKPVSPTSSQDSRSPIPHWQKGASPIYIKSSPTHSDYEKQQREDAQLRVPAMSLTDPHQSQMSHVQLQDRHASATPQAYASTPSELVTLLRDLQPHVLPGPKPQVDTHSAGTHSVPQGYRVQTQPQAELRSYDTYTPTQAGVQRSQGVGGQGGDQMNWYRTHDKSGGTPPDVLQYMRSLLHHVAQ
jgi:hypothetical protein